MSWLRREATKRWLYPLIVCVALACLIAVAFLLGSDNPLFTLLLVPVSVVLIAALTRSLSRRPRLSLHAVLHNSTTTTSGGGQREVTYAGVTLILVNAEGGGVASNCKVELETVAAPGFSVVDDGDEATQVLDGDTRRIVWQPSRDLGPGAERQLRLKSQAFPFDGGSASAAARVSSGRMDPVTGSLVVHVVRYDSEGAAEIEVTVSTP